MSIGHTAFHFSASGLPDQQDLTLSRQLMRSDWHIITPDIESVDIPYCAGYSEDGKVIYIDHEVPHFAEVGGKRIDVWQHVCDHEMLEKTILLRYGNEHYQGAHTIATVWEDTCIRAYGVNPQAYEEWWAPIIERIGGRKSYSRVPTNLDLTPYHDEQDTRTLKRMTFVEIKP